MKCFGLLWLAVVLGVPAFAQSRMPEIPSDKLTEAQKKAVDQFVTKRGGPLVRGPFLALLRSPDVMTPAEVQGE
jgi:4-carboxymuconolactone decarboxylase